MLDRQAAIVNPSRADAGGALLGLERIQSGIVEVERYTHVPIFQQRHRLAGLQCQMAHVLSSVTWFRVGNRVGENSRMIPARRFAGLDGAHGTHEASLATR